MSVSVSVSKRVVGSSVRCSLIIIDLLPGWQRGVKVAGLWLRSMRILRCRQLSTIDRAELYLFAGAHSGKSESRSHSRKRGVVWRCL